MVSQEIYKDNLQANVVELELGTFEPFGWEIWKNKRNLLFFLYRHSINSSEWFVFHQNLIFINLFPLLLTPPSQFWKWVSLFFLRKMILLEFFFLKFWF